MPSDLNLKKSWNPQLLKNREKVWQRECELIEQFKKAQNYHSRIQDVYETNELLSLVDNKDDESEESTASKSTNWMYQSSSTQQEYNDSVNNDVLLGKRKLSEVVTDDKPGHKSSRIEDILNHGLDKKSHDGKDDTGNESAAEKRSKRQQLLKSDPLYAIKMQEIKHQEMLQKKNKITKHIKESNKKNDLPKDSHEGHRGRDKDHQSGTHRGSRRNRRGSQSDESRDVRRASNDDSRDSRYNRRSNYRDNQKDNGDNKDRDRNDKKQDTRNKYHDRLRDYDPECKKQNYRDRN